MAELMIRSATPDDAEMLLGIYSWYVENTAITFEYEVPSVQVFRERIAHTLIKWPYLVLEQDGDAVGYAYADAFHARAAYGWCCELSIYLRHGSLGHGYGRLLYHELEKRLSAMGILNLYACIAAVER